MDRTFRPLETHERELLERLLDPEFAGRDELRRQLDVVTACQILDDGTLALQCGPCLPAPVKRRVPTEGECRDADGGVIQVLLHVVNGVMHELEIFKLGPTQDAKIINRPAPRDLVLLLPTPYGEAGVKWGGEERGKDGT
jgi:hypothetical protein